MFYRLMSTMKKNIEKNVHRGPTFGANIALSLWFESGIKDLFCDPNMLFLSHS